MVYKIGIKRKWLWALWLQVERLPFLDDSRGKSGRSEQTAEVLPVANGSATHFVCFFLPFAF